MVCRGIISGLHQHETDGYSSTNHAGGGNAPAAVKELLKLLPPASSFGGPYVNVQMLMEFMGGLDKLPAEGLADDDAPDGVCQSASIESPARGLNHSRTPGWHRCETSTSRTR